MKLSLLSLALVVTVVSGHDEYRGKCPTFQPMEGFEWDKFKGRWYAMEKFDTTNSKCITYDFQEDDVGFLEVVQNSDLIGLRRLAFKNKFRHKGKLAVPRSSTPADMIVRFQLNILGSASYVVLDTDYENYAMVCTCQGKTIFFDFFTFHRRSCTILQRSPERDPSVSVMMHDLVKKQIPSDDGELPDHDFDLIDHSGCDYDDDGKGLQIDVDKIIGATNKEDEDNYKDFYYLEETDKKKKKEEEVDIKNLDTIKDGLVELI